MEKTRTDLLLQLRPTLPIVLEDNSNEVEAFMHKQLRPILKFQNDWILSMIQSAQHFKHLKFDDWDENINRELVANFLAKNKNIRHQLLGGISALLTADELEIYLAHQTELNKRIMQMIITRFTSNYFANR